MADTVQDRLDRAEWEVGGQSPNLQADEFPGDWREDWSLAVDSAIEILTQHIDEYDDDLTDYSESDFEDDAREIASTLAEGLSLAELWRKTGETFGNWIEYARDTYGQIGETIDDEARAGMMLYYEELIRDALRRVLEYLK